MAKILMVGCGDVGSRLTVLLLAEGHELHVLSRRPKSVAGAHFCQGDVTRPETLQLPPALDYVFVILASSQSGEDAYRQLYLEGTRHVLNALKGQTLQRIFWVSSTSVYGQDDGLWVDEESPAEGSSASSRILLESEALVQNSTWPSTIVRFAGIYGPGRFRLLNWVKEGKPVQDTPPAWTNRIHVEDCAGLLQFFLKKAEADETFLPVYIGVDNEPVPQHEVLDWLAEQMQCPKVPRTNVVSTGQNKKLSNKKIRTAGYEFRYPDFRAGYQPILAEWRQLDH